MAVTVNAVVFFELANLIIWFLKKISATARLSVTLLTLCVGTIDRGLD